MREINLLDLAYVAEVKAELFTVINQLEFANQITKEEAAADLRKTVAMLMELEDSMQDSMQDSFTAEMLAKTKNRPNAATLASTR